MQGAIPNTSFDNEQVLWNDNDKSQLYTMLLQVD